MGKETGISWTDHTFNPWWGCTKVSPGCDHCYAEAQDARYSAESHWGKGAPRRTFGDKHWHQPELWNKAAEAAGEVQRVFCASMADVMDDEAPQYERSRLWDLIDRTPNLMWQLLTKRPQRFSRYLPMVGFAHNNVLLMTTAENQEFYNKRIVSLINASHWLRERNRVRQDRAWNAAVPVPTGVSYEPALGPISMIEAGVFPKWLIFGGETGADRRPMETAWAVNIQRECETYGVKFFMKQMSAHAPKQAAQLIPAELLIREFPKY